MVKKLSDTYELNNGLKIPCVGFGTWQTPDGEVAVNAVKSAIECGYRHIDTAAVYGNEESVGKAVRAGTVSRDDIFITTKLWNDEHGYEAALKACDVSLERLGVDIIDLYLIHWPNPIKFRGSFERTNAETWQAMEELYQAGKVKAIGVSNYLPHHLESLLKTARIMPMVNQIRLFPGYTQKETVSYCREKNILIEAYSPLGTGKLLDAPELVPIAEKYSKSPARICLRWSLQMGFLPLPKSVTASRIKENADIFDFTLSPAEMDILTNMPNHGGDGMNPDEAPF
ncbi:aldo/keto reductase [Brucepastera parasyntrophica]|uniref:aldo/keto reductase n=1 Tax=Brucepastera parasyntrophica TaxID=2880008 RepID=UPI00210A2E14|nr:aldo/keto reductase [Brucepastera parasyntrophica]ULQ59506.1 aldo/keto reductase [Brucepastera parasyntrophica]